MSAPERIFRRPPFLGVSPASDTRIDSDQTEYIRADLVEAKDARIEELEAAVIKWRDEQGCACSGEEQCQFARERDEARARIAELDAEVAGLKTQSADAVEAAKLAYAAYEAHDKGVFHVGEWTGPNGPLMAIIAAVERHARIRAMKGQSDG